MKDYDAIVIADAGLNPEALTQLQQQFGEMVARQGGKVVETASLGKRKFSFRIGKHREGHYLQLRVQMPPSGVDGLTKAAALNESIIRLMVVQGTGAPVAPVFKDSDPDV